MKSLQPEDLLDPAEFPDDLKWVTAHHRIHPTDPVYLLIAWHWRRVKLSEDTLKASILELKTALDSRVSVLAGAAETVAGINDALAGVHAILEEKPAELSAQLDAMLAQPIESALVRLQTLEQSLGTVGRRFDTSQRKQLLATFLIGVTLGVLAAVIVTLA
jgi:hypothetical protein